MGHNLLLVSTAQMPTKSMNTTESKSMLPQLLKDREAVILKGWLADQMRDRASMQPGAREDLTRQSRSFLQAFQVSSQSGELDDIEGAHWEPTREALIDISREQSKKGISPSEIATFIFSLKESLFNVFSRRHTAMPSCSRVNS